MRNSEQILNIGGKFYRQNCDDDTLFNNMKNGTSYLLSLNLVIE